MCRLLSELRRSDIIQSIQKDIFIVRSNLDLWFMISLLWSLMLVAISFYYDAAPTGLDLFDDWVHLSGLTAY